MLKHDIRCPLCLEQIDDRYFYAHHNYVITGDRSSSFFKEEDCHLVACRLDSRSLEDVFLWPVFTSPFWEKVLL